MVSRCPQCGLQCKTIDFDDHPVSIVFQLVALRFQALAVVDHLIEVRTAGRARINGQTGLLESLHGVPMGWVGMRRFRVAQSIEKNIERSARTEPGVEET